MSHCSSGHPRAGAGRILPVRVSSRAQRQVLYLKRRPTITRGCPPLHGVTTLQSPRPTGTAFSPCFWGHKKT